MNRPTLHAVHVLASVATLLALVGCSSGDPVPVKTTPLTITARLTAVSDSGSATSAPAAPSEAVPQSQSAAATGTGAASPTTAGAKPTANAPAATPDSGTSDVPPEIQALYACLRAHGIALDANGQPESTAASFDPGPAQKAFTECSASIIAQQSAGH